MRIYTVFCGFNKSYNVILEVDGKISLQFFLLRDSVDHAL